MMPKALSPGTSAWVRIACSPRRARAAARSPSVKRALAWGERTTRSHSVLGGAASAPKRSVPSTFGPPSSRAMAAPTALPASGIALAAGAASSTASRILR
jgi:hypothetical protein